MNFFSTMFVLNTQKCFHLLLSCFFALAANQISAQVVAGTITDTTKYVSGFQPELIPPQCNYPEVAAVSVVNYTTQAVAQMTIKANGARIDNLTYGLKGDSKTNTRFTSGEGGVATFRNLQRNQVYQVNGFNSCGKPVVLAEFNTYPYRPAEDGIKVSDVLYRHVSKYLANKEGALPLPQYIESLPNVDVQEKSAFLQQFFLKGAVLPDAAIGKVPTSYVKDVLDGRVLNEGGDGDEKEPCLCQFVLNQAAYAIPDAVKSNNMVERVNDAENGNWSTSRWWYEAKEGGPAKFQKLSSDGWKEDLGSFKSRIIERGASSETTNKAPNYATLNYTFLCVNYPAATPSECGCDKKINIRADYTSKVDVRATIRSGGGIGRKRSFARAQDFAVLFVTRTNENTLDDVKVLDAGSNVLTAECDGGVEGSDIINSAGDIIGSVINVVAAVKTGELSNLGAGIQSLTTGIANTFKLFEAEKSCTSASAQNTLVQGGASLTLKPNDPTTVVLLSGSRLETGGQRSWDSRAQINSDFYLTGVLLGSNSAPGETHCCTDYSAQWVYVTENRPVTSLQIPLNAHVFGNMNGAGAITINGVPSFGTNYCGDTEIGHATADFLGCEVKVPIYNFK